MFVLSEKAIDTAHYHALLGSESCGAVVCFEGRVRCENNAKAVSSLAYSAYPELAVTQGEAVLARAKAQFAIEEAYCVHRTGELAIGDVAVWIGVTAGHRDAAFAACRFIIDTVKVEVPIWKHEHYSDGSPSDYPANNV
ncbi:MAG: molybdenum cofactor biosynthesis protein MoaE [Neisseria sp.]|nr:molybdenum cofactor biosynthesis protein MoaE [Neisseria sp.]